MHLQLQQCHKVIQKDNTMSKKRNFDVPHSLFIALNCPQINKSTNYRVKWCFKSGVKHISVLQHFLIPTHTHTHLTAFCPGLPGSAGTRKVKPIWILLKQETVSGSGIRWAICKSAPRSRQITMPALHRSVFLQARCPSCHPTNSVKALKAILIPTADINLLQ